jgi:hypothetical protein
MLISLFLVLAGCTPQPASVTLDGQPAVTVTELSSLPLPHATVLDAKGTAIEPQPPVTWTVTPPEVAQVDAAAGTVVPLTEGSAQVTAKAGTVESAFTLSVRLPDKVEISGLVPAQTIEVGASLPVEARVLDGADVLDSVAVVWSTSNPDIARVLDGQVVARQVGQVTLTATAGTQTSTVDVNVIEAAAAVEGTPVDG